MSETIVIGLVIASLVLAIADVVRGGRSLTTIAVVVLDIALILWLLA